MRALEDVLKRGTSFGAPTVREIELAKMIIEAVPSIEKVRLTSSGTEATMTAIRLARGYTGKTKIIKFAGCYHGHHDALLVSAGSGALTFSNPDSQGVPEAFASQTLVAEYNNIDSVEAYLKANPNAVAAIIVEPVPGNMGVVLPTDGFLSQLRELTRAHGVLLIFDEVISGFRMARGGAQEVYGIDPDLTCLGKGIGGGMPLAAVGGKRAQWIYYLLWDPCIRQGHFPAIRWQSLLALKRSKFFKPGSYERLNDLGSLLAEGLQQSIHDAGIIWLREPGWFSAHSFFGVEQVRLCHGNAE
jgi:glutamate-1-semialdehyde 2,1-aminomutase